MDRRAEEREDGQRYSDGATSLHINGLPAIADDGYSCVGVYGNTIVPVGRMDFWTLEVV